MASGNILFYLLAFVIPFFAINFFSGLFIKWGISGIDIHKKEKKIVPESMGIFPLLSFIFLSYCLDVPFVLILPVAIAGIIGILDDRYKLEKKEKLT